MKGNIKIDTLSENNFIMFSCYSMSSLSQSQSTCSGLSCSRKHLLVENVPLSIFLLLYSPSYFYALLSSFCGAKITFLSRIYQFIMTDPWTYFFQKMTWVHFELLLFWIPVAFQFIYRYLSATPIKAMLMSLFRLEVHSNDHSNVWIFTVKCGIQSEKKCFLNNWAQVLGYFSLTTQP